MGGGEDGRRKGVSEEMGESHHLGDCRLAEISPAG
jgi:hypothetical protein